MGNERIELNNITILKHYVNEFHSFNSYPYRKRLIIKKRSFVLTI